MRTLVLSAGMLVFLAGGALAATLVNVESNTTAFVYLDGLLQGEAPITLRGLPVGEHRISVVDKLSGTMQSFHVRNRVDQDLFEEFRAEFPVAQAEAVTVREVPTTIVQREVVEVPVVRERIVELPVVRERIVERPVVEERLVVTSDYPAVRSYIEERERDRVSRRVRNTSLGLTGVGIVAESNLLLGAGLGGIILSEIID